MPSVTTRDVARAEAEQSDLVSAAGLRRVCDLVQRRPRRAVAARLGADAIEAGAVDVHDVDLRQASAIRGERELLTRRRPGGRHVGVGVIGDPAQIGAVAIDDVDLGVAVAVRHEGEHRAVGRPRRKEIVVLDRAARRVRRRPERADRLQDDVRIAASVRRVREGIAVRRPGGRDVERARGRQPRLVGAVVVGHVDVRDVAIADGPLHAQAVPVGGKGELGPRHAAQVALLSGGSRRRCRARRRARRR